MKLVPSGGGHVDGVTATVVLEFKSGAADEHLKKMPAMLIETRNFQGFRDIRVLRHEDNPDRLILIEDWDSITDYRAYVAWRTEQGTMDNVGQMLAVPPRIDVWSQRIL